LVDEHGGDLLGCLVLQALDETRVRIKGDVDARVSEALLNDLGMDACGQCECRGRVSQTVKTDRRQSGFSDVPRATPTKK
jgi:hypothetical protein